MLMAVGSLQNRS